MLVFQEDDREVEFREGNPRWVVTLSDGRKVYDNGRESVSTWVELHDYCYINSVWIKEMYAHFRSNHVYLPSDKDGYYFSRSVLGSLVEGINTHYFILGYLENNIIHVHKYQVPEMILVETEKRDPTKAEYQLISPEYFGIPKTKRFDLSNDELMKIITENTKNKQVSWDVLKSDRIS